MTRPSRISIIFLVFKDSRGPKRPSRREQRGWTEARTKQATKGRPYESESEGSRASRTGEA